jgi:hypothetical protein
MLDAFSGSLTLLSGRAELLVPVSMGIPSAPREKTTKLQRYFSHGGHASGAALSAGILPAVVLVTFLVLVGPAAGALGALGAPANTAPHTVHAATPSRPVPFSVRQAGPLSSPDSADPQYTVSGTLDSTLCGQNGGAWSGTTCQVPSDVSWTVGGSSTLTVSGGELLLVYGSITNDGSVDNGGTIQVGVGGVFDNYGAIENIGTVGTIQVLGTFNSYSGSIDSPNFGQFYVGCSGTINVSETGGSNVVSVECYSPSIGTTLSQTSVSPGGAVYDTASLSQAFPGAGGTVSYEYFSGSSCSGSPASAGTVTVTDGKVPDSSPVTFSTAGEYSWLAQYSGDGFDGGATSPCEALTVTVPWSVTFVQSGVPSGVAWGVTVGTNHYSTTGSSITVTGLSGTQSYAYDSPVAGQAGTRYVCGSGCSGTTEGQGETDSATYLTQFLLSVSSSPPGLVPGLSSQSGYYDSGATVTLSAPAVSGYVFQYWTVDGTNETPSASSITITMDAPHSAVAVFQTPEGALHALIALKDGMNIPHGLKRSLDAKLTAALASLESGNKAAAVNQLGAFINEVNAQTGKGITQSQALELTAFASSIIVAINGS